MNMLLAFLGLAVIMSYLGGMVLSAQLSLRLFENRFGLYFFMAFVFIGISWILITKFWFMVGVF